MVPASAGHRVESRRLRLVLLEHHWAVPLRNAIASAGGFRLADGMISPLDLVEIGLMTKEEAEELHAAEKKAEVARA